MATAQERLDLIDAAIEARLSGTAPEEWSQGTERFRYTPLRDLYAIREKVAAEAFAESGGGFSLVQPFDS